MVLGLDTRDTMNLVQDALPIVIIAVVVVAALVAVGTLVLGAGSYDQIGRSDMTFDREAGAPAADPFRDEELRQLLVARNARARAHGRAAVDVDAELAALSAPPPPAADDALRAEVRA